MDYYEDPYSPGLYRYETNRYPYVEVEYRGKLFHAQAHGWKGDMVMITRIKKTRLGRQWSKRNTLGIRRNLPPNTVRRLHMGHHRRRPPLAPKPR